MDGIHTTADAAEITLSRARGEELQGRPAPRVAWILPSSGAVRVKRILDILFAALLLIALSPLMLAVALLIRCREGGPLLVRQTRIGRYGRPFPCFKFRTMVVDADRVLADHLARDPLAGAEWASLRKLRSDPRVTAIGGILRRTSIDELPQLLNVLRGEMSLVGPRPVVQVELDTHYFGEAGEMYRAVRPGLTGLWQVSGRSDLSYRDRVRLDMEYVRSYSLAVDLRILLRTPLAVLRARGAC